MANSNLYSGLRWGLRFAGIYGTYAVLVELLAGEAALTAIGTTLPRLLAAYVAGGVVSGLVVGLLLPFGRTLWGASLIGAAAAIPALYAVGMAIRPPTDWFGSLPVVAVLTGIVLGVGCGVVVWVGNRYLEGTSK